MTLPKLPEADFIEEYRTIGPAAMAKKYGMNERSIKRRRRRLEDRDDNEIVSPNARYSREANGSGRINVDLPDGTILVGGDGHYWPGPPAGAHMAFCQVAERIKPDIVVYNGDAFDGAAISRWPPINWSDQPSVAEELLVCQKRLGEIQDSAGNAALYWTLGNHDARFEAKIAATLPQLEKVAGTALHDHFDREWTSCFTVAVNGDTFIKHRIAGGVHAVYNNVLKTGVNIITNHLHSPKVIPWTDYRGTRYGVDTGCLSDPYHPAFAYAEDNPRNWIPGFAVLTFRAGKLMPPELCLQIDPGVFIFRNESWSPVDQWKYD